jgi:TRAP-type uncharacterized transport system fused permease subunit
VVLSAQYQLAVPLMAAHLFCFYFGILADDTPPVGLAAYAGSAIAGSDPISTGFQAFMYDIRTAIIPFMFVLNSDLILYNITSWWSISIIAAAACLANMAFVSATQLWLIKKNKIWESALLLAVTLILFRPDLMARWAGTAHEGRYWYYIAGAALFATTIGLQKLRRQAEL